MTGSFRLSLYTTHQLSNVTTTQTLWKLLRTPLIGPRRFDVIENAEIAFDENDFETPTELYDREGFLFVRGSKDSFVASFSRQSPRLSTWDIYLNVKALSGKQSESWLSWFFELCKAFPVFFGYGCSIEEHDAKHKVRRTLPNGGRVTGWAGNSVSEFDKYLPGVYWLTIFGPALVAHFSADKLCSLPSTVPVKLDPGQIAIRIDEPVVPAAMEDRLKREAEIAQQLGNRFFFDRNLTGVEFQTVPWLRKALDDESEKST